MKKSRKEKPYWEMTADELAKATKQYDRPMPGLPGKPLAHTDRVRHARAKNSTNMAAAKRSSRQPHKPRSDKAAKA
jgi:hypothetical protein